MEPLEGVEIYGVHFAVNKEARRDLSYLAAHFITRSHLFYLKMEIV